MKAWFAVLLWSGTALCQAAPTVFSLSDPQGAAGRCAAPVSIRVDLSKLPDVRLEGNQLLLLATDETTASQQQTLPAQFEPDTPGSLRGKLCWLMPPGRIGQRKFVLAKRGAPFEAAMQAQNDPATGRWDISDAGKPVLRYNYQTQEPGDVVLEVQPDNRRYARPRSDYIHPLYGPDGEVLTKDWSVDHPHHRGIYPEINWFQPAFPTAGTRYVLKKNQPLVLEFRLWIHPGTANEQTLADIWTAYADPRGSASSSGLVGR